MYEHGISVAIKDEAVERYSLLEWERILVDAGVAHPDELPLSYSRIAELLAWELMKYGHAPTIENADAEWSIKYDTKYTDPNGLSFDPRVRRHVPAQQEKVV
jgi:hypothetical protein